MNFLKLVNSNFRSPLQIKPPVYFNLLMVNLRGAGGGRLKVLLQSVDGKQAMSSGIGSDGISEEVPHCVKLQAFESDFYS